MDQIWPLDAALARLASSASTSNAARTHDMRATVKDKSMKRSFPIGIPLNADQVAALDNPIWSALTMDPFPFPWRSVGTPIRSRDLRVRGDERAHRGRL